MYLKYVDKVATYYVVKPICTRPQQCSVKSLKVHILYAVFCKFIYHGLVLNLTRKSNEFNENALLNISVLY